jgi:hypothetical protein
MRPSFIPLSSFALEMLQSRGEDVECFIHLPHMKQTVVELYAIPPYRLSDMFILCRLVARWLNEVVE